MFKDDVTEAKPIVVSLVNALLEWAPGRGRQGADLRAKAGMIKVNIDHLLQDDKLGEPMAELFDLALEGGITLAVVDNIRRDIERQHGPQNVGAIVIKDCLIDLLLVAEGRIIAASDFRSRQDMENLQQTMNEAFNSAAEAVADRMDAMTYRGIIALHAAITFFLIEAARPRPRMMVYRFNSPLPTLVQAYRLYADASRSDELIYENRIVHPLFPLLMGKALSA